EPTCDRDDPLCTRVGGGCPVSEPAVPLTAGPIAAEGLACKPEHHRRSRSSPTQRGSAAGHKKAFGIRRLARMIWVSPRHAALALATGLVCAGQLKRQSERCRTTTCRL